MQHTPLPPHPPPPSAAKFHWQRTAGFVVSVCSSMGLFCSSIGLFCSSVGQWVSFAPQGVSFAPQWVPFAPQRVSFAHQWVSFAPQWVSFDTGQDSLAEDHILTALSIHSYPPRGPPPPPPTTPAPFSPFSPLPFHSSLHSASSQTYCPPPPPPPLPNSCGQVINNRIHGRGYGQFGGIGC